MGSQLSQEPQTLEQALTAAQRALTLNDAFSSAQKILGYIYLWQKQYEHAIAEMEQAITLDPNEANGYADLAVALSYAASQTKPYGGRIRRCAASPL